MKQHIGYHCANRSSLHGWEIPFENVTDFGLKLLSFFWMDAKRLSYGGTTISINVRPAWWRMRIHNWREKRRRRLSAREVEMLALAEEKRRRPDRPPQLLRIETREGLPPIYHYRIY